MLVNILVISNSRVAVRDYKVKKCLKAGEDLDIRHANGQMVIKHDDIKRKILHTSKESYEDKDNENFGQFYHLCFFQWKPMGEREQLEMILGY